jgi:hypothetical protein
MRDVIEKSLLGMLMKNPEKANDFIASQRIIEKDFDEPSNRTIFDAIIMLHAKNKLADTFSVMQEIALPLKNRMSLDELRYWLKTLDSCLANEKNPTICVMYLIAMRKGSQVVASNESWKLHLTPLK